MNDKKFLDFIKQIEEHNGLEEELERERIRVIMRFIAAFKNDAKQRGITWGKWKSLFGVADPRHGRVIADWEQQIADANSK